MKLNFSIITSILFMSSLYAASINEQIEAIKNASPAERVELMNRLKTEIAAMNEEDRANAINTLQQSRGGAGNRLQLRLHQGSSQETGSPMQRTRLNNGSLGGHKQQGRQ